MPLATSQTRTVQQNLRETQELLTCKEIPLEDIETIFLIEGSMPLAA
jgi:hypothetical protein